MSDARQVERMNDDELRAIELDENTMREDLDSFAASARRLAQMRQAEADLKDKAAQRQEVSVPSRNKNTKQNGRPQGRTPGSKRDVAEATGIPLAEQVRVEKHVAIAERYPFMQRDGWQRHLVLDAGDALDVQTASSLCSICTSGTGRWRRRAVRG